MTVRTAERARNKLNYIFLVMYLAVEKLPLTNDQVRPTLEVIADGKLETERMIWKVLEKYQFLYEGEIDHNKIKGALHGYTDIPE